MLEEELVVVFFLRAVVVEDGFFALLVVVFFFAVVDVLRDDVDVVFREDVDVLRDDDVFGAAFVISSGIVIIPLFLSSSISQDTPGHSDTVACVSVKFRFKSRILHQVFTEFPDLRSHLYR